MSDQPLLQAWVEAGLQAHNQQNLEAAKDAFQRALAIAPNHPGALNLYGVTLLQLGQPAPALEYLQRAAHIQRNNPAVLGNLAQAYFNLKRYDEAREIFRKAGRLDPRNAQFPLGAANALAMQGQHADAEAALRRLADRFPRDPLVWYNLGNVQRDAGRAAAAADSFRQAAELDPQAVEARNNLGSALQTLLRFEEAEREYRACIRSAPDFFIARCNLASVVIDLGRFSEGEELCRELVRRKPDLPHAHSFLGVALSHQGRLLEALASHRAAATLAPEDAKTIQTYASTLIDCGQLNAGLHWFSRALALNPRLPSTHQLLGQALLGHGCLAAGWAEYAHRPWRTTFNQKYPRVPLAGTLPAELAGARISVMPEQGLGDEIFFLRYVPQLHAAGARVSYCTGAKLGSLLARVASIDEVRAETAVPPADATAVLLAGDLPHASSHCPASPLPPGLDTIGARRREFSWRISAFWPPAPPPLELPPLAERCANMRRRLAEIGDPPYLGVTWRGGTPPREQRAVIWMLYKEIGISRLAAALKNIPGTFIALQRNPAAGELEMFSHALGRPVHDFTLLNEDLEDMLALLALIDEYIGVSNTNMHLRAGAGKTARVLVPRPADWRWQHAGRSSPWFPGFSIYRQSLRGDWDAALAALRHDLAPS